jgi:hypothetical protein
MGNNDADTAEENTPYSQLNSDNAEIRLLTIKAGDSRQRLQCRLNPVSLNDEPYPEYETIS